MDTCLAEWMVDCFPTSLSLLGRSEAIALLSGSYDASFATPDNFDSCELWKEAVVESFFLKLLTPVDTRALMACVCNFYRTTWHDIVRSDFFGAGVFSLMVRIGSMSYEINCSRYAVLGNCDQVTEVIFMRIG